ncbi:MAG: hypothetical protein JO237_00885, partial [Pseudolabrys sp.]|nr:hypothetical protein [Pseudolabrys sp.]
FKWTGKTKADGSGSVGFNKTLHTEWDMKVGGNMSLDGNSSAYDPRQPVIPGLTKEQRSRDAWANVAVPEVASVEVRVAPGDDQRKIGTSVQRSVPISSALSVTLQNDLSLTENSPAAAPLPPIGTTSTPGQVWDNAQKLKLNIGRTGTTFAAASSNASSDPVTHRTLSAEQKIYGNLNVTTAITDPGQPTVSKSIKAGLKFDW